ncbi:hypothetical protein B296_00053527 [Ensete ventricosum]|uniref:Uncharacterized protein n=1 Tax=Ensete ventricosum TaxID=4639 RepID=A0A426Y7P7_ENSVE|nr:hypothetical protein B296_00053527 [Ensete ventricosum]
MARGGVIVEATTSSSTEPLLSNRTLYTRSLSYTNDKLKSVKSYLRWMYVDQSKSRHAIVTDSLILLPGVFVPISSHFVLSCAPTSSSSLSYLCLFVFICRSLFLDKMNFFLT